MKFERRHLICALKRSAARGAMMYILVAGLGLVRSVNGPTWIAGLAFAFFVHAALFGAELWRILRGRPAPPPRGPDR